MYARFKSYVYIIITYENKIIIYNNKNKRGFKSSLEENKVMPGSLS